MKQLHSGIFVNSEDYYKLLDWVDKNRGEFEYICDIYHAKLYKVNLYYEVYRVNDLSQENFQFLVDKYINKKI